MATVISLLLLLQGDGEVVPGVDHVFSPRRTLAVAGGSRVVMAAGGGNAGAFVVLV